MPDDIIFEFRAPSNIIIDVNKESNNIIINIVVDLYNTIAYKLGDMGNILDVPGELMAVDILGIAELNLTTSEYNIMDLDILRAKSRA
jgi:hypothetical protein